MNKNHLVVKANDLIEAFFGMTQNEYKFILFLMSKIRKDDTEFRIQEITVQEFNDLLDIKGSKTYSYMRSFEDSLLTKKIVVNRKDGEILKIVWFSYLRYLPKSATLKVAFNADLSPFLLQIDIPYTKYLLSNVRKLSSYATMRLYEILKQYEKLGKRVISFNDLRHMLGFQGEYERFNDFKRRVLEPGRNEINAYTDLYFDYAEIRVGKKLKELEFDIKNNNLFGNEKKLDLKSKMENEDPQEENKEDKEAIQKIIKDFNCKYNGNLDKILTRNLVKMKGIDCIKKCVDEFAGFVTNANEVEKLFYDFAKKYATEKAYTKSTTFHNSKPIQATNYEQRTYTDEEFEDMYDNVKFTR